MSAVSAAVAPEPSLHRHRVHPRHVLSRVCTRLAGLFRRRISQSHTSFCFVWPRPGRELRAEAEVSIDDGTGEAKLLLSGPLATELLGLSAEYSLPTPTTGTESGLTVRSHSRDTGTRRC